MMSIFAQTAKEGCLRMSTIIRSQFVMIAGIRNKLKKGDAHEKQQKQNDVNKNSALRI
jgi:hypothetical protein